MVVVVQCCSEVSAYRRQLVVEVVVDALAYCMDDGAGDDHPGQQLVHMHIVVEGQHSSYSSPSQACDDGSGHGQH